MVNISQCAKRKRCPVLNTEMAAEYQTRKCVQNDIVKFTKHNSTREPRKYYKADPGVERQPVQKVVQLPFIIVLCILSMIHTCKR